MNAELKDFKGAFDRVSAKYQYQCEKEAAELYPVVIATSERTVREAPQVTYGGTGNYSGSCRPSAYGGYNCDLNEKKGIQVTEGKQRVITNSYDANKKQRLDHVSQCKIDRVRNSAADQEMIKPFADKARGARDTYEASK